MGTGGDDAELPFADVSQPLHDRDRALSGASRAGSQQLLRPAKQARYAISDAKAVTDGSWYSGVPLWSLAESQGMHAACLFWPGSEAEIAGHRPTWYAQFDSKTQATRRSAAGADRRRGGAVAEPEAERPHFIAIYYSEPDHEGHEFGPDAPETKLRR